MTKEPGKDPHNQQFLTQRDVHALKYARDLAVHMLDCEGVIHREVWKDLPSYKAGFAVGCMAVADGINAALEHLKQETKTHDK